MNAILSIPPFIWLLLSAMCFAAGEFLSKVWALRPSFLMAVIVVLVYACGTVSWLPALFQRNHLTIMGTVWLVLAMMATVLIGTVVFRETLTWLQWVGCILALGALILLAS